MSGRQVGVIAVLLSGLCLAGCYKLIYSGDGTLHDAGPLASVDRFTIDLAKIDLATTGTYNYRLRTLPETRLTIGLQIVSTTAEDQPIYETKPLNATVRFEMSNERNEHVVLTEAPMRNWTWSGWAHENSRTFVYRKGDSREVPLRPGVTTYEPLGVNADSGWGSYFTPRRDATYLLKATVVSADPRAKDFHATLWVQGGGWK